MSVISERLEAIKATLPSDVTLVAVSKYYPQEAVVTAYKAGQRVFGESRAQELLPKYEALPKDISWHFIGHLQVNKVKYIAPFVSLIHAVDKESLLVEINRQASRYQRMIPCLLQLHVAQEETKFGFTAEELENFLSDGHWKELNNINIVGLMCMASNTDDISRVRNDFQKAKACFDYLKTNYFSDSDTFCLRSWGMSGDYRIAIEEGSNMVRIGSAIFSED
ncbi:MAG: YggS family pyridoxal phosphate-dependent enzyme [Bacteroidales bacterium]|nr:YggS family pyridoxal phosphate-dependent enzyme [Bacteroidales bacterium]